MIIASLGGCWFGRRLDHQHAKWPNRPHLFWVLYKGFLQSEKRILQSSVFSHIARTRLEFFNVPEQGFGIICVEIKNNHVEFGGGGRGALASESVTEFFKLSLHQFISYFSVSELQWYGTTESDFRLTQPHICFCFVAKDLLGSALDQLNIIHAWPSWDTDTRPFFSWRQCVCPCLIEQGLLTASKPFRCDQQLFGYQLLVDSITPGMCP